MKKYTLLAAFLALCACNNGGGSSHSSGTYNTPTKPGMALPDTGNSDKNPEPEQPSQPTEPDVPGTPKEPDNPAPSEPSTEDIIGTRQEVNMPANSIYRATIDNANNEIYLEQIKFGYNASYVTYCKSPNGCSYTCSYGASYSIIGDNGYFTSKQCTTSEGCYVEIKYNDPMPVSVGEKNSVPHGKAVFALDDLEDGELILEYHSELYPTYNHTNHIILGSKKTSLPLKFSDFGYWEIKFDTESHAENTQTQKNTEFMFTSGDPSKEVNMKQLYSDGKVVGNHTFTGKALVKVSDFVATGDAKLTFNANNGGNEYLNMNFRDAGWYDVFVNVAEKDLRFEGTPTTDSKYIISKAPLSATETKIKYYGTDTATEAVGTVKVQKVLMQDRAEQDINFSFGAVKD